MAVVDPLGVRSTGAERGPPWHAVDSWRDRTSGPRGGSQRRAGGEVVRQRRGEGHALAGRGVREGEAGRVQGRPLERRGARRAPGRGARTGCARRRRSRRPTTGWPSEARCTRIWCVRPVWMRTRSEGGAVERSSTLPARCAPRGRAGRGPTSACAGPGRGRWGGRSLPLRARAARRGRGRGTPSRPAAGELARTRCAVGLVVLGHDQEPGGAPVEPVDDARGAGRRRRRRGRARGAAARSRACRSALPAPGWTTRPAGLSTTRRWASSWTTRERDVLGLGSAATGGGHVERSRPGRRAGARRRRGRAAVDEHVAAGDQRLEPRAAEARARAARARRRGAALAASASATRRARAPRLVAP